MGVLLTGGIATWLLLAGGALGLLWTAVCGVLAARGRRIAGGLWLLPPAVSLALGFAATGLAAADATRAMQTAAEQGDILDRAPVELVTAWAPAALGTTLAVPQLLLIAWLVATTSLAKGGDRREWTPGQGAITLIIGCLAPVAALAVLLQRGGSFLEAMGATPYLLVVLTLGSAPAIGLASAHRTRARVDASRLAGARGLAALAAIGAVLAGGLALGLSTIALAAEAASSAGDLYTLTIGPALASARLMAEATTAAIAVLMLAAAVSLMPVGGHLNDRASLLGGVSLISVALFVVGLSATAYGAFFPLRQLALDRVALMDWAGKTRGLPETWLDSTPRPAGACIARRRGSEWVIRQRFQGWPADGCGQEEGPLAPLDGGAIALAAPGDLSIGSVLNTQWFLESGELFILTQPTSEPSTEELALIGPRDLAISVAWELHPEGEHEADLGPAGLRPKPPENERVVVRADPRMNLQDLVDACTGFRCVLTPSR